MQDFWNDCLYITLESDLAGCQHRMIKGRNCVLKINPELWGYALKGFGSSYLYLTKGDHAHSASTERNHT
ncbi:hypothetical protein J27TS7_49370 [Paenibacillus dendritiformis]|nr:hypothetical protein J27TS7_49370 [Paenibacillus dendritiformis]